MSKKSRDRRPYQRPVTRIELPHIDVKARSILVVILLIIAAVAFATGVKELVTKKPGWQEIVVSSREPNCADQFQLMYDFSEAGSGATAQYRQVESLYTQAVQELYVLFSSEHLEEGQSNIAWLNAHPGEEIQVEGELYAALEIIAESGNRHSFLAPVMAEYDRLFQCEGEGEATIYDPTTNPETAEWIGEAVAFARDPEHIRLEMLGENRVKLVISPEYEAFCQENELDTLFDLGWMENAFLADAIAGRLIQAGFTNGYLVSFDGFTRNLDTRATTYSLNLYDSQGTDVYMPAKIVYSGPMSLVSLRGFPLTQQDRWSYYAFSDGRIVSHFVDPADGMSKTASSSLLCYSENLTCGELALRMADLYVSEELAPEELLSLTEEEIYSVWSEAGKLFYNDPQLNIELLPDSGPDYSLQLMK